MIRSLFSKKILLFIISFIFSSLFYVTAYADDSQSIDLNKLGITNNGNTQYNLPQFLQPTAPSQARGTIIEDVNGKNENYPVGENSLEEKDNKDNKNYYAPNREFLTFASKNGKIFHLIIDRDKQGGNNVQLLTEVSENDLLNLIVKNHKNSNSEELEKLKNQEPQPKVEVKEKEVKEVKKSGNGGIIFLLLVGLAGGGAYYYFKIRKPKVDEEDYEYEEENEGEEIDIDDIEDIDDDIKEDINESNNNIATEDKEELDEDLAINNIDKGNERE